MTLSSWLYLSRYITFLTLHYNTLKPAWVLRVETCDSLVTCTSLSYSHLCMHCRAFECTTKTVLYFPPNCENSRWNLFATTGMNLSQTKLLFVGKWRCVCVCVLTVNIWYKNWKHIRKSHLKCTICGLIHRDELLSFYSIIMQHFGYECWYLTAIGHWF